MERVELSRPTTSDSLSLTLFAGGGTEQRPSSVLVTGQIWKYRQNGMVYDPEGIAPCLCVGNHSGVEPKIIEYEY